MEAARDISAELHALAEQLAAEPFCHKYGLEKQTLAKVSLFIEQRETSLERVAPEQESLKESFRKFKAIYCLFLMQLEQLAGLDAAQLNSIKVADYLSNAAPEEADEPTMVGALLPLQPVTPPPAPTAVPAEENTEVTMMGNIINFVAESPASPTSEMPQLSSGDAVSWAAPDEEGVETLLPGLATAEGSEAVTQGFESPQDSALESAETGPTVPAAQEYFAMAHYFRSLRETSSEGFPPNHLARLEGQQLCFAIEVEWQEKLVIGAAGFWPQRKEVLATFWDATSARGDLHPALVGAWEALAQGWEGWPKAERFPTLTLKNSLRFLAGVPDAEPTRPSLLEAGLWLFLLGQNADLGGLPLTNALGLPAIPYETLGEIFLRLCRAHRLKAVLLNPASVFSEEQRQELENHAAALFAFSRQWNSGS